MNMRRHTLSRGKQWICHGLTRLLLKESSPPYLHSHSLRGKTQSIDWQKMTFKFIQATMKLATKACNLFCASYHPRIKSILPCNKSSFCRLHKAVELLTIFFNNFSQPATIWFFARKVWLMGGSNLGIEHLQGTWIMIGSIPNLAQFWH